MSNSDGDSPSNTSLLSHLPWAGIAVPLAVVAAIGIIAMACTVLRRRRWRQRHGFYLNQQGHMALERDILADGAGRPRHGSGTSWTYRAGQNDDAYAPPSYGRGRRQPRTANRWAWTNAANLAVLGGGHRSRRVEEGLDEFGEAPPPYELPPVHPKAAEDEGAQQRTAAAAAAASDGSETTVSAPAPAHVQPTRRTSTEQATTASSASVPATPSALPPAYNEQASALAVGAASGTPASRNERELPADMARPAPVLDTSHHTTTRFA